MSGDPKISVAMPFTITDVVQSLRELLGLAEDVTVKVKAVSEAFQHHRSKRAAKSLDVLTFHGDGSRKHLERIAAGQATEADFEAITTKMDETGIAVERSIEKLRRYREFLRQRYGLALANKIDALVYGDGGKTGIRADLLCLATSGTLDYSTDGVKREAARIFRTITELNKRIEELHDQLLKLED